VSSHVLELSSIVKQYGALRPLRVESLSVAAGDQLAIIGLDQPAAETFISVITGASLPDQGSAVVFGRSTVDIADSNDWLSTLDRFGIVSERAVFLEPLSVVQNLAVPFSLEIEPPPPEMREKAIALAQEVGLDGSLWDRSVRELDPVTRIFVRLARALALDPALLVLEHPSATLPRDAVTRVAQAVRAVAARRQLATLTLTMDEAFASAAAAKILTLDLATGRLAEKRAKKFGFWS
jgi:ABC-type transporter Mla maintaining outer membrane lipid asymmetry ATPase subunit MlaF